MEVSSSSSVGVIEKGVTVGTGTFWKVLIKAHKLVTPSGKTLPYSTWIGTIRHDGTVNLWTPAASGIPRDYKKGAMPLLLVAYKKLVDEKLVTPSSKAAKKYQKLVDEYHWYI